MEISTFFIYIRLLTGFRHSIQQITTERAKSSSLDLHPNYHNETTRMMGHGERAVQVLDRADKVVANDVIVNCIFTQL